MKEKDIKQLQQQCEEYLEGWKRAKADLANYKKEEELRAKEETDYVIKQVLKSLLPTIDSMERAKGEINEEEKDHPMYIGLLRTYKQMEKFLEDLGVEEIKASGEFDPEFHEAIREEEGGDMESGEIIEVLEKGYTFKNKVIKATKVKIAK